MTTIKVSTLIPHPCPEERAILPRKDWAFKFFLQFLRPPGPSCSKLGYDNPGLVRDLNSDLKALKAVQF